MIRFVLRRIAVSLPVLAIVITAIFLLIHLIPGDPVVQMLGEGAAPVELETLRKRLGLDQPLHLQFLDYWKRLLRGNLGTSFKFNQPVTQLLLTRYPATLSLALVSMIVAIAIAIPAGVTAAVNRHGWTDRFLGFSTLLGLSFPNFVLGPVLILVFSIQFGWLPVSGRDSVSSYFLPALTMGTSMAAILTRMVRSSMLEQLSSDYVRTARAKGLSRRAVLYRHALRNGLIPVTTIVGLQFGALLAGAIITETIFSWPGLGRLTIESIHARDYPLLQGCVLSIAVTYVLVNFLTDLTYSFLDPRIRAQA